MVEEKSENRDKIEKIPKKHEISIDEAVSKILEENTYLQVDKLVGKIEEMTEYKEAAIRKRLGELNGLLIAPIRQRELKRYGINARDGRRTYFILKDTRGISDHIAAVIELLNSKSKIDVSSAINELERYESRYILGPTQLDSLVDNLDSNDSDMVYELLRLLFFHLFSYEIRPSEQSNFLDEIHKLLKKNSIENSKNIHVISLWILGFYDDKSLIDYLKSDLNSFSRPRANDYRLAYEQSITSKVIEAGRTELFNFQRELEKKKLKEQAELLSQIRSKAAYDVRDKRKDEAMKMPDQVNVIYKKV